MARIVDSTKRKWPTSVVRHSSPLRSKRRASLNQLRAHTHAHPDQNNSIQWFRNRKSHIIIKFNINTFGCIELMHGIQSDLCGIWNDAAIAAPTMLIAIRPFDSYFLGDSIRFGSGVGHVRWNKSSSPVLPWANHSTSFEPVKPKVSYINLTESFCARKINSNAIKLGIIV